jgi:hypothetical protein
MIIGMINAHPTRNRMARQAVRQMDPARCPWLLHRGFGGVKVKKVPRRTSQPKSCQRGTPATAKAGRQHCGSGAAFTP